MNVSTIEMPRHEAREAYLEYKHALKQKNAQEVDEALMRGYREIAKGRQIIDLEQAIVEGGQDEEGRPRLAIIQADREWCHLRNQDGNLTFTDDGDTFRYRHAKRIIIRNTSIMPPLCEGRCAWHKDRRLRHAVVARAMVPTVPPQYRPGHHLRNYHILFEAEWKECPPVDPILLKHLGGHLYAVMAQWDLSPLERCVLKGVRI